ncbi:gas vesicle protein [Lentzea tibetensis]|uniref:Gas vesicle protein n=1 Tax=Lentzea tibetensis TaxID=2591470 RepID=A0A563ES49_9PSEU|nr:gas vesicle protein [Lentzea tibetensis]TWP50473.1 gas vesicle protein [Lentzea tibetensis]
MSVDSNDSSSSGKPVKLTAVIAIRTATEQFGSLTGRAPEAVTGVRALPEGGWSVLVDVLELERVPATTSIMATYRVDVDATGELFACERLRRYTRGTTDM